MQDAGRSRQAQVWELMLHPFPESCRIRGHLSSMCSALDCGVRSHSSLWTPRRLADVQCTTTPSALLHSHAACWEPVSAGPRHAHGPDNRASACSHWVLAAHGGSLLAWLACWRCTSCCAPACGALCWMWATREPGQLSRLPGMHRCSLANPAGIQADTKQAGHLAPRTSSGAAV